MADANNDADNKAGANGGADDAKADDKKPGNDKAGKNKDANGGDQKTNDQKKPISFDSQEELDEIIETRIARAKKQWQKEAAKTSDDDDADDDDKKKAAKKTAKADPEKEQMRQKLRINESKDAFIAATGLPYEQALRVFNIYKGEIEFGDDDKPLNLRALAKQSRDEYPELYPPKVGGKGDGGGGDNKQAAGGSMDNWLRSQRK